MMWSRHSRRNVPITRSAIAFAFGAWMGVTIAAMPMRPLDEVLAVTAVTVAKQIAGVRSPRCGLDQLSPDPLCCRVLRDIDVDDAPTAMRDEDEGIYRA